MRRAALRLVAPASLPRPRPQVAAAFARVRYNQQAPAQSHLFDDDDHMRRRLLYRSKQRGWLEMDIMLGNWAANNLADLDSEGLEQFQEIIDLENPDLYRWLTGQAPVPDDVDNSLLLKLCNDLRNEREPKVTVRSASSFEGKVWE
jgi:succinate dehydrogenase flavin-adding protein (antitoxin of CptAB toxin-antitoxin module)